MDLVAPRRPSRTVARRAVSIAFMLVSNFVGGCGSDGVDGLSLAVDEPGPFAVGYREFTISYPSQDGGPDRTIPVAMWYPADARKTAALAAPEPPRYLIVESKVAVIDAPLAPPAYHGGYPVIVHSHGHWAYETHNYNIGEGLATLGYVVVAPGHVGDRIFDINTMVDAVDDLYKRMYDVRATLDMLENLPETDPLSGLCNTDRVVITGHSRGTSTVWGLLGAQLDKSFLVDRCTSGYYAASGGCPPEKLAVYDIPFRDPRIVAGVPMAGDGDKFYFGGFPGLDAVSSPVLMMSASANPVGDAEIFANVTNPPLIWIEFAGGCHNTFGSGECAPGAIDNSVAIPAINTYIHALARRYLFDDPRRETTDLLDGTRSLSSIITYHGP